MKPYTEHNCEFIPQEGVSIYTEYPEDGHRESVSTLVVERQATEDDLEENSILNEVGESMWIVPLR